MDIMVLVDLVHLPEIPLVLLTLDVNSSGGEASMTVLGMFLRIDNKATIFFFCD